MPKAVPALAGTAGYQVAEGGIDRGFRPKTKKIQKNYLPLALLSSGTIMVSITTFFDFAVS